LLQIRLKTEGGTKTIAPVGKWVGTYFSEELKAAENLGYKFKILRGYLFNKELIFDKYITDLYYFKEISDKNSADYTIYKLLMNSLYGRFGMSTIVESQEILEGTIADKKFHSDEGKNKFVVTNTIKLSDTDELVSYYNKENTDKDSNLNISVPIASAITSYARIFMSTFKNRYSDNLYYSDTDSLYLDTELDPSVLSSTEIGKFKLENIFTKALFLAPKMYSAKFMIEDKLNELTKIKGSVRNKTNIRFNKLISLLYKDKHLSLIQEKWFRDKENSTIKIVTDQFFCFVLFCFCFCFCFCFWGGV
jgi:hypothetical protein